MLPSRQKEMIQWASGVILTVAFILIIAFIVQPESIHPRVPSSVSDEKPPSAIMAPAPTMMGKETLSTKPSAK